MKLPTYPLATNRRSPIVLLTNLGWLTFVSTASASPASDTPEEIIERLTGFTEVEITQISPREIHIHHHNGDNTLTYDELPMSLRNRFGMIENNTELA